MRKAARSLVESRSERFPSRHGLDESRRRLAAAVQKLPTGRSVDFSYAWEDVEGDPVVVARFSPPRRTKRFINALSLGMAMLVAGSAWAMISAEASGAVVFLLPMITILAILGFPFLILALASNRASEEAVIGKALRVALLDEEKYRVMTAWED